jgi:hypothetical protein
LPINPTVIRLLGTTFVSVPAADEGMIHGAATIPENAAVRPRKLRLVIKGAFVVLLLSIDVIEYLILPVERSHY